MKVLIGHTGLVGSNLARQTGFDACYNSSNIAEIEGRTFDLVVCAGVRATMWEANNNPEADWNSISSLATLLGTAKIGRLVLISTVAVLDDLAAGRNESDGAFEQCLPYGINRRRLEVRLAENFERTHVLRLPALFGAGLKKNFIFDLLNPIPSFLRPDAHGATLAALGRSSRAFFDEAFALDPVLNMFKFDRTRFGGDARTRQLGEALMSMKLDSRRFTNHRSTFQFYDLSWLWQDIERCIDSELPVVHVVSEPLEAVRIAEIVSGSAFESDKPTRIVQDVRSIHAGRWPTQQGQYLYSSDAVLGALKNFASEYTATS